MARQVTETPPAAARARPDAPLAWSARSSGRSPRTRPTASRSVAEFATPRREARGGRGAARRPLAQRCIAVLPFVNASPDPENEYLSDGITDELIDALAKVDGLRVASRTSVFALKGKPQDVRAIGALLGASEVLEGTRAQGRRPAAHHRAAHLRATTAGCSGRSASTAASTTCSRSRTRSRGPS